MPHALHCPRYAKEARIVPQQLRQVYGASLLLKETLAEKIFIEESLDWELWMEGKMAPRCGGRTWSIPYRFGFPARPLRW